MVFFGIPSLSVQCTSGATSAGDPAFCCSMRMSGETCVSGFHTIFRSKHSLKKVKRSYIIPNKLADHVKKSSNAAHLRERVTQRKRFQCAVVATSAGGSKKHVFL
jgi:hypothetical protein